MTSTTFGLNAANDIYINSAGSLQVDNGLQALVDACKNASQALLGEEVLTTGNGVPYFQALFTGNPNIAAFQNGLTNALNSIPGVTSVSNLSISVADNILTFVATIQTIYGPTTLTNSVAA